MMIHHGIGVFSSSVVYSNTQSESFSCEISLNYFVGDFHLSIFSVFSSGTPVMQMLSLLEWSSNSFLSYFNMYLFIHLCNR